MQTPEKREKAREATRKWRAANRERANEAARAQQKKWRELNPELHRARAKAHKAKDPVRAKENHAAWRAANRDKLRTASREAYYRLKYGMTIAERDEMLLAQDSRCKVCRSPDPQSGKGWHIDHCHTEGHVRGILCQPCNHALGNAKDNPETLRRMAAYLEGTL